MSCFLKYVVNVLWSRGEAGPYPHCHPHSTGPRPHSRCSKVITCPRETSHFPNKVISSIPGAWTGFSQGPIYFSSESALTLVLCKASPGLLFSKGVKPTLIMLPCAGQKSPVGEISRSHRSGEGKYIVLGGKPRIQSISTTSNPGI